MTNTEYPQYTPPTYPQPVPPRGPFYRPSIDRKIGGVCSGIARYFGWDPTVVRIVTAASIVLPGPQVLAYLILWIVMPDEATVARQAAQQPHVR